MTSDKDVTLTSQEKTPPSPTFDSEDKTRHRWSTMIIAQIFVAPICFAAAGTATGLIIFWLWTEFASQQEQQDQNSFLSMAFGIVLVGLAAGMLAARKGFRWFLGFMEDD